MKKKIDSEKTEEKNKRVVKTLKGISRKTKIMPGKIKESGKKYVRGNKND